MAQEESNIPKTKNIYTNLNLKENTIYNANIPYCQYIGNVNTFSDLQNGKEGDIFLV